MTTGTKCLPAHSETSHMRLTCVFVCFFTSVSEVDRPTIKSIFVKIILKLYQWFNHKLIKSWTSVSVRYFYSLKKNLFSPLVLMGEANLCNHQNRNLSYFILFKGFYLEITLDLQKNSKDSIEFPGILHSTPSNINILCNCGTFIKIIVYFLSLAGVTQWLEQLSAHLWVVGSNPRHTWVAGSIPDPGWGVCGR